MAAAQKLEGYNDGSGEVSNIGRILRVSSLRKRVTCFEAVSERESNCCILAFMMDGGGENLTREWHDHLGIQLRLTQAHSPEMNGLAERLIRTLTEHASVMLWEAGLPM